MPYKLVIFDFDGTLADSITWFLEAFNDLAERHRFRKASPEEIEELRGQSSREIVRRLRHPDLEAAADCTPYARVVGGRRKSHRAFSRALRRC